MKEFSCTSVRVLVAARPARAPSMAPAPARAVIFSASLRDVPRTLCAIIVLPTRWPQAVDVMGGKLPKSTALLGYLAQQKLTPELHQRYTFILDDIGRCVGFMPGVGNEAAGADHVDRRLRVGHDAAFVDAKAGRRDDAHMRI